MKSPCAPALWSAVAERSGDTALGRAERGGGATRGDPGVTTKKNVNQTQFRPLSLPSRRLVVLFPPPRAMVCG